jgi:hypothetical protein
MFRGVIRNLKYLKYVYMATNYSYFLFVILGLIFCLLFIKRRVKSDDELEKAVSRIIKH